MLKKVALSALLWTFGLLTPVLAADLKGGNDGVADLEERVAELEATTARKGNRRMSVTVYGQVNKSVMWHDVDSGGAIAKRAFGDGSQSPTHFGFMGKAKINAEWSAGFLFEFGADENRVAVGPLGVDTNEITVRHSAVWIEAVKVGRLTLGHTSTATDGIAEITMANTAVASKMLNLEPFSSQFLFGLVNLPFDGDRRDIIRYDSPSLGGLILSASWGAGDRVGPVNLNGKDSNVWDIALRYAAEAGGFRMGAGIGYRHEDYSAVGPLLGLPSGNTVVGSASVKHLASGLFASGAYGKTMDFAGSGSGLDLIGYHGQGGLEVNITGIGTTTFFGEWGRFQADMGGGGGKIDLYGLGAIQAIDAAAMDLYVVGRQYDLTEIGLPKDTRSLIFGARIRF